MNRLLSLAVVVLGGLVSGDAFAQGYYGNQGFYGGQGYFGGQGYSGGAFRPQIQHQAVTDDDDHDDDHDDDDDHNDRRYGHGGHGHDHNHWHHDVHVPSLSALDNAADRLASVARHLHDDAHQLSQDYEHSDSIEYYVDRIDRLQRHLHEILHEAARQRRLSPSLIAHVKEDVRQVKIWITRLQGELQHQGYDGVRPNDYRLLVHMQKIITGQALPLVRQMEIELYGPSSHGRTRTYEYRFPVQTVPSSTRTQWRISFGL